MTSLNIYEDLIKKASDPDTMPDALASILQNVKTDMEEYISLQDVNKELNDRVKTLQNTNTKLLLSQLGKKEEEEREEKPKELTIEEFSHNL